ncbi:MAG TPA: CxxxxCH/CxxCH domain-containing protein [Kofleriaceae bacterium]|nr:CxxxxCH/CxxCH domain-containing protein [Kofleriaceae bacterium]
MRFAVVMLALASCSEERVLSQPCDGYECVVTVHERGIQDEDSADFHGKLLARTNWDFAKCASCHGADFAGGTSGVSCLSCHKQGPTACATCHREERESGSHKLHRSAALTCAECHVVPASWDAPGHIVDDSAPAEVTFGALAATTLDPADRAGPPTFDGSRCSNVYCHGAVMPGGGTLTQPVWNATATGACGSCHAAPPPSHARTDCATCHPSGAPHVDGIVNVGKTNDCSGCHGSASSPAPPADLAGNMFTTAIGVGAHQAHLQAPSGLRGPIPCETCHAVPATVTAVGHLDPAPAEVNAELGWNRTTQTCTTWCHGVARPAWTSHGEVVCGSCHGAPPSDANHNAQMTVTTCVNCHAAGKHMNGVVDGL